MAHRVTRRAATALLGAAGVSLALPRLSRASKSRDPLSGEALYELLESYTLIGEHRTGTTGDLRTSAWIEEILAASGLETKRLAVPVNLFEVTSSFLELDHERNRVDPEWYPTPTPPAGITAPLRLLGEGEELSALKGSIWVVDVQMARPVVPREFRDRALAAARAGALGVVMVLRRRCDELIGRGAHGENGSRRWIDVPLVAVAAKHGERLRAAARERRRARLLVQGRERPDAKAFNVAGSAGRGEKVIVVTTPQSGMFRCGGERGGGIALLLGLARWVGSRRPQTRYLFSTNTGHEQSGSGAGALLEEMAPDPETVKAWLHLGSGIATWSWSEAENGTYERIVSRGGVRNFGAVPALVPLLLKAFASIPDLEPQSDRFAGELAAYVGAGYPGFGFWGYNRFGHTVADGPEQSAPELLEPVARGLEAALEAIEAQ